MADNLETRISNLASLSLSQLRAISEDFRHPDEVQEAARALIKEISDARLRAAVANFNAATPVFTDLTQRFVELTTLARKTPGGDAVATLTPVVRQLGDIFETVTGVEREHLPPAGSDEGEEGGSVLRVPAANSPQAPAAPRSAAPATPQAPAPGAPPPPPGTVSTSRKLSEIAGE